MALVNRADCARSRGMGAAGRLYLILVGLILCAAGAVFVGLMWRSFNRASDQRQWTEVSCQILESQVRERQIGAEVPVEYGFGVLYAYDFEGKSATGSAPSLRGVAWSHAQSRAESLVAYYPVGSTHPCFVNPADPTQAVLKLDSKAPGYSLWFPLLIIAGGGGIIVGALRAKGKGR
jgi:hypothetical protein